MSNDNLGDRMKANYEDRTRYSLPRRTYTVIRVDGKAFHTFTSRYSIKRPYDADFAQVMNDTAMYLCMNIQGAKLAFVQSDEISVIITDFATIKTEAWFDANLQKMCSVSAALATAAFNKAWMSSRGAIGSTTEVFDSRVFQIPDPEEVSNYLIWRQQDATRNSISMMAQSLYSHNELLGKNSSELQELSFQKGVNWNDYPTRFKRGGLIAYREGWQLLETPIFTTPEGRALIRELIPRCGESEQS